MKEPGARGRSRATRGGGPTWPNVDKARVGWTPKTATRPRGTVDARISTRPECATWVENSIVDAPAGPHDGRTRLGRLEGAFSGTARGAPHRPNPNPMAKKKLVPGTGECAGVMSRELTTPLRRRSGDAGGDSRARGERESKHGSYATPRGPRMCSAFVLSRSFSTGDDVARSG